MQVTARFQKNLHILAMVLSVLNIVVIAYCYRISNDWTQLGAATGWIVAVMYEYLVIREYPFSRDTKDS
ncbi:hypothetical protein [Methanosarcina sp.]|uniref:hypothetical protein n=1 Tax=Methanosarcina sp. TaxID=2213 RepID=UPI003C762109